MTTRDMCDGLVLYGLVKCILTPLAMVFTTGLGPVAFFSGAIIVATILFGEFYFRDV